MAVNKTSNQQQILQGVLDEESQALKTKIVDGVEVSFEGGSVECDISADTGDNIAIADASTGVKAGVTAEGRLKVETTGDTTVSGEVSIPPSTDFQTKTVTVTDVVTALNFGSLSSITSIAIKAPTSNTGDVKIGKADVSSEFYLLSPGESVVLPVFSGATVYHVRDAGAGDYTVSALAVN